MFVINAVVWFVVGLMGVCVLCWVYSLVELLAIWLGWKEIDK